MSRKEVEDLTIKFFDKHNGVTDKAAAHYDSEDFKNLVSLTNRLDPAGALHGVDSEYMVYSQIDIPHNIAMQRVVTGLVGFLTKAVDNFMPVKDVPEVSVEEYLNNPSILDPPEHVKDPEYLRKYALNKHIMDTIRVPVYAFLEEKLGYNPTKHIKSVYYPSKLSDDRERILLETEPSRVALKSLVTNKKFAALCKTDEYKHIIDYVPQRSKLDNCKVTVSKMEANKAKNKARKQVKSATVASIVKEPELSPEISNIINKYPYELFNTIPSVDFMHNLNLYITQHYESICELTSHIYGSLQTPSYINVYGTFKTEAEAKQFISTKANQFNFKAEIAMTNKWIITSPNSTGADRNFIPGDAPNALRDIIENSAENQKIAQEMMKNNIKELRHAEKKKFGKLPDDSKDELFQVYKSSTDMAKYENSGMIDGSSLDISTVDKIVENPSMQIIKDRISATTEDIATNFMAVEPSATENVVTENSDSKEQKNGSTEVDTSNSNSTEHTLSDEKFVVTKTFDKFGNCVVKEVSIKDDPDE